MKRGAVTATLAVFMLLLCGGVGAAEAVRAALPADSRKSLPGFPKCFGIPPGGASNFLAYRWIRRW